MIELRNDFKIVFGDNLKKMIDFSEKNQREIAKEIGCSQKSISNWINGTSQPKMEHILRMVKYFDCDYDDLFDKL